MGQRAITKNTLFYGDNLPVIREYLADETVDLIYLDPPFNSSRSYNVLYKDEGGAEAEAQIMAFEDTWHWNHSTETQYRELAAIGDKLAQLLETLVAVTGRNQMMAYLVMMAARLIELHRVLKPTGSLYLHCDPTASHYLKLILDMIFGAGNFQNEIIWRRTGAHNKVNRYAPIHDVILFYTKSNIFCWKSPKIPYMRGHIENHFIKDENGYCTNYYGNVLTGSGIRTGESGKVWKGVDPTSKNRHWAIPKALVEELDEDISHLSQHEKLDRLYELGHITIKEGQMWPMYHRYLNEKDGQATPDIWAYQPYTEGTVFNVKGGIDEDVRWLSPKDQERLGYPTQKPIALLERIIQASSTPGDIILDPFCGCGTAVHAAQKLGRVWIGIDITPLATALIKSRLYDAFKIEAKKDYDLIGEPTTLSDAKHLANQDRYQFQWWALGLIPARPYGGQAGSKTGKKGADKGIDGVMTFSDSTHDSDKRIIIQVKSGKVKSSDIRDLHGTIEREKNAVMGIFVTLEPPSRNMELEAMESDYYHSHGFNRDYPKIQILTIEQLLAGEKVKFPGTDTTLKQAQREQIEVKQRDLL